MSKGKTVFTSTSTDWNNSVIQKMKESVFDIFTWMLRRICLIVTAGIQSLSSLSKERHTAPEGYTLGWKIAGKNMTLGGVEG